jgi:cellulose synthase/poly-beta-1,6-N-acetylglucosamine synthase-like glycosyltransferase
MAGVANRPGFSQNRYRQPAGREKIKSRSVINRLLVLLSWPVVAVLLLFTARRWLLMLAALWPDKPSPGLIVQEPDWPDVLLLIPVRNEAPTLPELCRALEKLIYPASKLVVVFINDGSTDESEAILQQQIRHKNNRRLLSLEQNVGKANALNRALAAFPQGELVAIYDADERPQAEALQLLVQPFADNQVGGVSGRRAVNNSLNSPAAGYTTFEGLVHQLVTMRAKDRLNLAPAILGANCAYRRTALAQVGGFKPGALLEDSDLTLKLVRAGWQIRFEPAAISYHRAPESISGYWRQHTRWARGFNEVAKTQATAVMFDKTLSLPLRVELLLFALGYLDRLALLVGLMLALTGRRLVGWSVVASLMAPLLQTMAALKLAQAPAALWRQTIWLPLFFALDVAMAIAGLWGTLRRAPQIWEERGSRK